MINAAKQGEIVIARLPMSIDSRDLRDSELRGREGDDGGLPPNRAAV